MQSKNDANVVVDLPSEDAEIVLAVLDTQIGES